MDQTEVELKLPTWINNEYFEDILLKSNLEYAKIINWTVKMAHGKGENYLSNLYRAKVEVETIDNSIQEYYYILKVSPDSTDIKEYSVFEKEFEMYNRVLPNIEQLIAESSDTIFISPRCYKSAEIPVEYLVLEDLSQTGYKMANRIKGVNMDHVKVLLKKLAKFHAASACFIEQNGPYPNNIMNGMFNETMQITMKEFYDHFFDLIASENVFEEKYVQKFQKLKEEILPFFLQSINPIENSFNVLNHGDLWTNNVLFKYDGDGKPNDVLFVDYQTPSWGSPAIDLWYFIITSCALDIKISEIDYMLQFYHEHLSQDLESLQYKQKIPTLLELQINFLEKGGFAVLTATGALPVVLNEVSEGANFDNLVKTNDDATSFKIKLIRNPRYIEVMEVLLPYLDRKGFLDTSK